MGTLAWKGAQILWITATKKCIIGFILQVTVAGCDGVSPIPDPNSFLHQSQVPDEDTSCMKPKKTPLFCILFDIEKSERHFAKRD